MSVMTILATIRTHPEPTILLLLHSIQEMLANLHQVHLKIDNELMRLLKQGKSKFKLHNYSLCKTLPHLASGYFW
jgi:hypothetical protein